MRHERLLGLLIAVVLVSGLAASTSLGGSAHTKPVGLPSSAPSPVTATSTPPARPRPTASPTQRMIRPGPTATPSATATPLPSPVPARTISRSGRPGDYAPLSIRVTLSPGGGTTQTAFRLRVVASDGDGDARIRSVSWGDGSDYFGPVIMAAACVSPSPPPPHYLPHPTSLDEHFAHAWRHAGSYRLRVFVDSGPGPCRPDSRATAESQAAVFLVSISQQGPLTSNGPAAPVIDTVGANPNQPGSLDAELFAPATDSDGWISGWTIDWGDRTPLETHRSDPQGCDDGKGAHYPTNGGVMAYGKHHYAQRGSYRITVTASSTGCQGKTRQLVSKSGTARV